MIELKTLSFVISLQESVKISHCSTAIQNLLLCFH